MIYLLIGENDFEISEFLEDLKQGFEGQIDTISSLQTDLDLSNILLGRSLFSLKRMVILKSISENKEAWQQLPNLVNRIDDDLQLVIVEPKPDKRSKTYKDFVTKASVKEFNQYDYKNSDKLRIWLINRSKQDGIELSDQLANLIIERAGFNQWALVNALERLSLAGEVSRDLIVEQIEPSITENIFQIFELVFRGDSRKLKNAIDILKQTEDAYKTLGLISMQLFILLAIKNAPSSGNVASDFGANPYMISKLRPLASKITNQKIKKAIDDLLWADDQSKSSGIDPWVSLEQALMKVALN